MDERSNSDPITINQFTNMNLVRRYDNYLIGVVPKDIMEDIPLLIYLYITHLLGVTTKQVKHFKTNLKQTSVNLAE